jgi:hypothetical protein
MVIMIVRDPVSTVVCRTVAETARAISWWKGIGEAWVTARMGYR